MKQLLYIHGGNLTKDNDELLKVMATREINPFEEKKRRRLILQECLPEFVVIKPEMPNKDMARYSTWKLWFEKYIPFLDPENLVLVGHSLGGMFLTKYLAENEFPIQISQLHLVAPVLDNRGLNEGDNYLGDFAYNVNDIKNIS
jgi:BH0848 protein